jgi:hypothetical protein
MPIFVSNLYYQDTENHPIIGWHSVLGFGDFSADSELPNRPALNLWNPDTSSVWESDSTDEQFVYMSNSGAVSCDYVGIAKHNFGTGRVTYQIQKSVDNSTWVDVTAIRLPANDAAIVHYFEPSTNAFWRLRLVPISTPPVIAHIKLGIALVLQRKIYVGHKPATLTPYVKRITLNSQNGQYLGDVITQRFHKTTVSQENITPDFIREKIVPFINHITYARIGESALGAFFFAWRPIDYPLEVVYGWTDDTIHPENQRSNGMMSFSFAMEAVV